MNKREFLRRSAVVGAGTLMVPPLLSACINRENTGRNYGSENNGKNAAAPFRQVELKYSFDALEPYIDAKTMEIHYSKHHAGYTSKLNAAVEAEGLASKSIFDLFSAVSTYSAAVRNNVGGYFNHNLYWQFMSPDGGGESSGTIKKAINKEFGSFDKFKELFSSVAGTHFGSGWAWLILNNDGRLVITSTPNQDNPLMDISTIQGIPLLNIDVWEHAYYLHYQNQRSRYIEAYWNVIDWNFVEKLYLEATG